MKRIILSLVLPSFVYLTCFAQLQSADGEGTAQATALKKLNKKARFGAYLIEKEVRLTGRLLKW